MIAHMTGSYLRKGRLETVHSLLVRGQIRLCPPTSKQRPDSKLELIRKEEIAEINTDHIILVRA